MSVVHFGFAADGGASRAGRRASDACQAAGLDSAFAFVEGKRQSPADILLVAAEEAKNTPQAVVAEIVEKRLSWEVIPKNRTEASNTLFSLPYPGMHAAGNRLFEIADILHIHWPSWGITPAAIEAWLQAGRQVFWTLHDCWPVTGGCHYPAGCTQYQSACLKCPQLTDELGLAAHGFAEKLQRYGEGGALTIIAPSHWIAGVARSSAILRGRPVHVVRNAVELDVFSPPPDRAALRAAMGVAEGDLVLLFGSYDLVEKRKGVALLMQAVRNLMQNGALAAAMGGGRIHLASFGKSPVFDDIPGILPLQLGSISDDSILASVYGTADLVCLPSLEDNYPNTIIEAFACGTPCLGYAIGGVAEMITDGETGILVDDAGCIAALEAGLLRFAKNYFGDGAMRAACRASAEACNAPARIGEQLKALYEAALGRKIVQVGAKFRQRILKTFAATPVRRDVAMGRDFLQFPLNLAMLELDKRRVELERFTTPPRREQADKIRLLSVRTYHSHHSARSGPYQFLRHLPENYAATHMAVPLGDRYSGERSAFYRKSGALMGVKGFGQQGNAWLAEMEILCLCATEKVDVVHFIDGELGGWLLAGVPEGMFHGGRRPLLITTFHQPPSVLRELVNADLVARFDGVIALCETQKAFLESYTDRQRVFLAPHGIDTEFFIPAPASYIRKPSRACRLLLVGHWLRDLDAAIEAFGIVAASISVELTVISPNFKPKRRDRRIIVRSGLSDEALREAYWNADVLLLPLIDATANNAILEAMACGLAVVSTDVGGVREGTGEDAAMLCPPGDAQALAAAVLLLAADPARRVAMAAAGRRRAEALAWHRVGVTYDEIYSALQARRAVPVAAHRQPIEKEAHADAIC